MISDLMITLDRVTDYTKQPNGSWHADLYQPIRLHVEGRSPDDCRYRLAGRFGEAMVDWLERCQKQPTAALTGEAETAIDGEAPANS